MSVVDAATPKQTGTTATPEPGMKVAVRNRYLGTWSVGFEVVATHLDGYSIRRTSDGAVLPGTIPFSDVREPWGPPTDGMS